MIIKVAFFPGSFKPPHVGHYTIVKELLPKVDRLYIFISKKSRDGITAEESLKIWKIYLSKNDMKKIIIHITDISPIIEIYKSLLNNSLGLTVNDKIYLIKSHKDVANKRFDLFKKLKLNITEWTVPTFKTISSTNMRQSIIEKNYKKFHKFIPLHLSENKIKDIWNILTI